MESSLTLIPKTAGAKAAGIVYQENMKAWVHLHTQNRYHDDTIAEFISIKDIFNTRA